MAERDDRPGREGARRARRGVRVGRGRCGDPARRRPPAQCGGGDGRRAADGVHERG